MEPIEKILIATDLSDPSLLAINAGAELAEKFGSALILGYVAENGLPLVGMIEYSGVDLTRIEDKHRETAAVRLKEFASTLKARGLSVEIDIGVGVPHHELVRMAERHSADLLVMGTHGRGFISHIILGSTTERVLRHAPCPVYVVRDPRK